MSLDDLLTRIRTFLNTETHRIESDIVRDYEHAKTLLAEVLVGLSLRDDDDNDAPTPPTPTQ